MLNVLRLPDGFSEADFQATLDLVEEVGFDVSFSFVYSARPGTPAAALADKTPAAEKKERLSRLQNLLRRQSEAIANAMVGTVQEVLVTGTSKKDSQSLQGRTQNNRGVNFAGDPASIGDFATVEIVEALPNSLRGTRV